MATAPRRVNAHTVNTRTVNTRTTTAHSVNGHTVNVRTVNMLEAKTQLSKLVDAIERGVESEVVIARNGRPVARLTSLAPTPRPRRLGVAKGVFVAPESIDQANPLIADLFEQG